MLPFRMTLCGRGSRVVYNEDPRSYEIKYMDRNLHWAEVKSSEKVSPPVCLCHDIYHNKKGLSEDQEITG